MGTNRTHERVREAIRRGTDWLWSIRNPDFSWGDHVNRPPDLSGCAEGMLGILKAGEDKNSTRFQQSLSFLKDGLSIPWDDRVQRDPGQKSTRCVAWPVLLLFEAGEPSGSPVIRSALSDMERFRVGGEGYSTELGEKSNTFDTCLAIECLLKAVADRKRISEIIGWLKSAQSVDGGWAFHKGEESNPVCTAQTVITLIGAGESGKSKVVSDATGWLLSMRRIDGGWDVCLEDRPLFRYGKWFHYSSAWVLLALLTAGFSPSSEEVDKGIRALCGEQDKTGGWKILPDRPPFTHATAHALRCLGEYLRKS